MVCTFMLFVLPAIVLRSAYWFWGWLTGKKQQPAKAAKTETKPAENKDAAVATAGKKPAAKGTCPYHVVMRLLGFKIPEKKQQD